MIRYDPVADKLENEDEEPSVESEHSDLSPQFLHDDWLQYRTLSLFVSEAAHISNHLEAVAALLCGKPKLLTGCRHRVSQLSLHYYSTAFLSKPFTENKSF